MGQSRENPGEVSEEVSESEIQQFVNNPALDLPETRRDLSKSKNVHWMIRNIKIRNIVSPEHMKALADLLKE